MSFVLDALKISEQKRSKLARPVYAHPPRPLQARRRRLWLGAISLGGAAALVLLAWRLLIPQPPASEAEYPIDPPAGAEGAVATAQETVAGGFESTAKEAPGQPSEVLDGSEATSLAPIADTSPADSPIAMPPAGAETNDENVLSAAPPDWPDLTLQMLYYDPQGVRSFVQINGRSYRGGERLEAGPQVREITSDAVILSQGSQRVRLSMDR